MKVPACAKELVNLAPDSLDSMSASHLKTKSLTLVPWAPEHLRMLLQGTDSGVWSFGWPPDKGLQDFFAAASGDMSSPWLAQLEKATLPDPWTHGFGLVHLASGTVIGTAGFKGPPGTDGMVEIAYGVVPNYQGKGYATEAAEALVAYAFNDDSVRLVRAHTLPEPTASTRVLTKCGFRRVGEVIDHEDGLVWRWEKEREPVTQGT